MERGYGVETGAIRLCVAVTGLLLAPNCEQSAISNSVGTNQLGYKQTDRWTSLLWQGRPIPLA